MDRRAFLAAASAAIAGCGSGNTETDEPGGSGPTVHPTATPGEVIDLDVGEWYEQGQSKRAFRVVDVEIYVDELPLRVDRDGSLEDDEQVVIVTVEAKNLDSAGWRPYIPEKFAVRAAGEWYTSEDTPEGPERRYGEDAFWWPDAAMQEERGSSESFGRLESGEVGSTWIPATTPAGIEDVTVGMDDHLREVSTTYDVRWR